MIALMLAPLWGLALVMCLPVIGLAMVGWELGKAIITSLPDYTGDLSRGGANKVGQLP